MTMNIKTGDTYFLLTRTYDLFMSWILTLEFFRRVFCESSDVKARIRINTSKTRRDKTVHTSARCTRD